MAIGLLSLMPAAAGYGQSLPPTASHPQPPAGAWMTAHPDGQAVWVPLGPNSAPVVQNGPVYTVPMMPQAQMPPTGPVYPGMVTSGVVMDRGGVIPTSGVVIPTSGSEILPAQNTAESARQLHRLIESMPTSQEDLELIERRSQLMTTRANVTRIHIADPSIVDVVQYSPRELSFIGLARGSTTLTMWFEGTPEPIIYLVKTIRDPNLDNQRRVDYGKLEKKINTLFPNSKVYLVPMSYKIIVRGQARDQEEAAHILAIIRGEFINQDGSLGGPLSGYGGIGGAGVGAGGAGTGFDLVYGNVGLNNLYSGFIINELRVPGEFQISLRVRIAELNRSQARSMGVDLSVLFSEQLLFTNLGVGAAATLGGVFENGDVSVLVNWLASNGTAKILTEPNVVVISGRQARFLAGGEFAVPTVVGIGGAQGQTTSFRGFGTSLLVTPAVVDRDLIRISTVAEYSNINGNNTVGGIPGTDSRRVETTVELREGQTLALAGLLSHREVTEVTRIPVLGDIPKVGPLLFSSKRSTQEENELLILITPEIVRPMDAHEVPPVPGFEVTVPSDYELYKHNVTEGMPDTGYYQLPPYGSGSVGTNVGYQHFNPGPAASMQSPVPSNPYGTGFSSPNPIPNGMPSGPGTAVPPTPTLTPIPSNAPPQPMQPSVQRYPAAGPPNGWSRPAGSTQTIQPANYTGPRPANPGNTARTTRDQSPANRY